MFVYVSVKVEQREQERVGKAVPLTVESAGPPPPQFVIPAPLPAVLAAASPWQLRPAQCAAAWHCLHSQLMVGGWSITLVHVSCNK